MGRRRSATNSSGDVTSPKRSRRNAPGDRDERDRLLGGTDQGGRQPARGSVNDFRDANRALHDYSTKKASELTLESHDLNFKVNHKAHHTDEYDFTNTLLVRRGQSFSVSLVFNREFKPDSDTIILQFTTGSRPMESKGTVRRVQIYTDKNEEKLRNEEMWRGVVDDHEGSKVKLLVTPSVRAVVGWYSLFVETVSIVTEEDKKTEMKCRKELEDGARICVLFNAWCPGDSVYMEDEKERYEYVLNEQGRIWTGRYHGRPWDFGQFEHIVLEAALALMDKAEMSDGARSNPVLVTRMITALANSCDENGVLTGRWSDTYPKNSTVPWAWTGSVAIIDQFMQKRKPVCFGQCWVFSGITTTLLRSLGIPTRSVTNFQSAHDTDCSTSIDYHFGEDDKPLEELNNDSVWNFHVWNESWFKRYDLPDGYDGWQALDATPQETSEGIMQCGPASVKAIKEGNVYLGYDARFIFAEVNGDKVYWRVKSDGSMEPMSREHHSVGQHISTKAVGNERREDVTGHYKYPEGSEEERKSVVRAHRYAACPRDRAFDLPDPDVSFKLELPEAVEIGQPIDIKVKMHNKAGEDRDVSINLTAVVAYYTGVSSDRVGHMESSDTIPANSEKDFAMTISFEDYMNLLKPDSTVKVFLMGNVKNTGKSYAHVDTFQLLKPSLKVQVPERVIIGSEFEVSVGFTNPMKTKLTSNTFSFEGPGITYSHVVTHKKAIDAGEEVTITTRLTARRSGNKELVVAFNSDQLTGLIGSANVYVAYSE